MNPVGDDLRHCPSCQCYRRIFYEDPYFHQGPQVDTLKEILRELRDILSRLDAIERHLYHW